MGRRPLFLPKSWFTRWHTMQVTPSRETGEREAFGPNKGSPMSIPTGVWQRMQKSPSVPLVFFRIVACIALNTGESWEYACGDTDHSR